MTHRDELLALKARVEAQERAIDEAKSENELLRAAHAHKTREAETLRRELDAAQRDLTPEQEHPPPIPPQQDVDTSKALRFAAMALGMMMIGTLVMSSFVGARARQARARMLYAATPAAAHVTPLVRSGTVIEMSGPSVVAAGEVCTVERIPMNAGPFDCRIEVRCGDQTLYGHDPRTGFVRCGGQELVRDGNITAFDGDPAMTLDLARGIVTVEDRVGLATQRVRIQL